MSLVDLGDLREVDAEALERRRKNRRRAWELLHFAGVGSGMTAAALSWRDAVIANGGTVSAGRLSIVNTFILAEQAAGCWDLTDDYWGLWAENAIQALTSLKQRRLATAVNSPTFTPDRDYTFDGATNTIDTGHIPATHAVAATDSNVRLAVYERTNVTGNSYAAGALTTSARALRLGPRNAGVSQGGANTNVMSFTLTAADSRGFTAISRNGGAAADCAGYKNGSAVTRASDPTTFGTPLPAHSIYIGGYNNAGAAAGLRACAVGFLTTSASFSAVQEAAQNTNVQAWATAVGANV